MDERHHPSTSDRAGRSSEIAVIVPAFNAAATIERTLASIERQTLAPAEVVVVDDGSNDGTPEVVERYARSSALPLRLVRQENRGASAARNAALNLVGQRWIAGIDADDEFLPGALAALHALVEAAPEVVLAFGNAQQFDADGTLRFASGLTRRLAPGRDYDPDRQPLRPHDLTGLLLFGNFVPAGGHLARRESVLAIGGFDERLRRANDRNFFLRLSTAGPAVFTLEPVVSLHYTAGSLSHVSNAWKHAEASIRALMLFREWNGPLRPDHQLLYEDAIDRATRRCLYYASLNGSRRLIEVARRLPRECFAQLGLKTAAESLLRGLYHDARPSARLQAADPPGG